MPDLFCDENCLLYCFILLKTNKLSTGQSQRCGAASGCSWCDITSVCSTSSTTCSCSRFAVFIFYFESLLRFLRKQYAQSFLLAVGMQILKHVFWLWAVIRAMFFPSYFSFLNEHPGILYGCHSNCDYCWCSCGCNCCFIVGVPEIQEIQ